MHVLCFTYMSSLPHCSLLVQLALSSPGNYFAVTSYLSHFHIAHEKHINTHFALRSDHKPKDSWSEVRTGFKQGGVK